MARRSDPSTTAPDRVQVERTRISAAWIAIAVALVFLILLIVFIAENNRPVKVSFFGASGQVSEALALVIAAVAGAVLVLLVGTGRLLQLRLAAHRHNREARKSEKAAAQADADPVAPPIDVMGARTGSSTRSVPARTSVPPAAQGETQAVDTER